MSKATRASIPFMLLILAALPQQTTAQCPPKMGGTIERVACPTEHVNLTIQYAFQSFAQPIVVVAYYRPDGTWTGFQDHYRPSTPVGKINLRITLLPGYKVKAVGIDNFCGGDALRLGIAEFESPPELEPDAVSCEDPSQTKPDFAFDLGPSSPETQRRVLTHKYRSDDSYPSPYQTSDANVEIRGRVTKKDGTPFAGKTVYFRVADPPDSAAYSVANGQAHDGDNFDGNRGTLSSSSATSDSNGVVKTTLLTTTFAAGDSYIVESSFDPAIVSDPAYVCAAGCWKSGTFTVWKRVYVEVNKMFRKGAYLTASVPAGATEIPVSDVKNLSTPFRARLIHAPPVGGTGNFYDEEVTIVALKPDKKKVLFGPQPGRLLVDPKAHPNGLQHSYSGPEVVGKIKKTPRIYLADAIGAISGNRSHDYYLPVEHLVAPLFDRAFVEHIWLNDSASGGVTAIPFDGVIPSEPEIGGKKYGKWHREWLTRKWLRHAQRSDIQRSANPNHQVLFAASKTGHAHSKGVTSVGGGFNDAWLYTLVVGNQTRVAEATAHELAHEWRVNPVNPNGLQNGGHCDDRPSGTAVHQMFNLPKMCIMTSDVFETSEAGDGILAFHYVMKGGAAPHSEYLYIRRRPEPVPQNEHPREDPE